MIIEKLVTPRELEIVLNTTFDERVYKECEDANLTYRDISPKERDDYLNNTVSTIFEGLLPAGPKRLGQWESGWEQNLEEFRKTKNPDSLIPKYHGKHEFLRWRQQIIKPTNPKFDYNIHCVLVDWLFSKYLSDVCGIFEFGCGPAYHLLRARKFNKTATLVGLDWTAASQEIIREIHDSGIEQNILGHNFDFFNPNHGISLGRTSGVITIAALEQIGAGFGPFVSYLLEKKPAICVHVEPIDELMDQNNLIDNLSVLYCRKRNYLYGFLTYLRMLEKEGKIEIINQQRTYTGSQYIEGHSVIVWRPL